MAEERKPSAEPVDEIVEENVIEPIDSEVVKRPWYAIPRPRVATILTTVVGATWSYVAIKTNFNGPPILDSLLLLVFGGYFADSRLEKKREEKKKDEQD